MKDNILKKSKPQIKKKIETQSRSSPSILTIDIETAPLKVYAWSLWDENTGINQIDTEWTILSVAWKWLDSSQVYYMDCRDTPRDDSQLLQRVWNLLDSADIVVTQNGMSFDVKKINSRLLMKGFPPYSPIRQVDTKRVAKKHFSFTSNRLEWMGHNIAGAEKSQHKKFPGFELWLECLKGNKTAWDEMSRYNKQDVLATEALYLKMLPWIENHPNVATYIESTDRHCPKCGSSAVQSRGYAMTQTGKYPRFCCTKCGGWSRGARTALDSDVKRNLLKS